jgi:rubrerythrin
MAHTRRARLIKALVSQKAEDAMWGIPESPEFSSVQRLMNEFQSHATNEERWLLSYKEFAKEASDPLIRFLLGLVIADEERHHELTSRMIGKLKDELAWTRSEGSSRRPGERGEEGKRMLALVDGFLKAEQQGIKEYERLKRTSQGLYRDVFTLLYTTMIHDSQKHIGILEFLRRKLKENQRPARKRQSA